MKKLVQINVVCNGSTGRIMCDIAKKANEEGFKSYCFYGRGNPNKDVNCIKIDTKLEFYFHALLTRLFNLHGHGSYFATKRLVKKLKKLNPDVIHLHNIHGYYINLKVLFKYLKNDYKGKIVWTLHDCWAFTGHCAHFIIAKCQKWKNSCHNCPQIKEYPKSFCTDTSKSQYLLKKKLFTSVENLTIVTPSSWLKNVVMESFLKNYPIEVINNGINLEEFKPTYDSSIYEKYGIPKGKKIILGVANVWNRGKGLNYFIDLNNHISDKYTIVIIGLSKRQIRSLPKGIIGIEKIEAKSDLIKIYSESYVFYNPSLQETFSMVTAEAINCGKSVIVFDTTATKEIAGCNDLLIENAINKSVSEVSLEIFTYLENIELKNNSSLKFGNRKMTDEYLCLYNQRISKHKSNKIKILQICSSLNLGGVEMLAYNLYNNFDKERFDFSFITFEKNTGTIEKQIKSPVFHIPRFSDGIINYYKQLNKVVRNYDIIHCHIGVYSFICLFIAWKNGIKIRVCHSHNYIKNTNFISKIKYGVFKLLNRIFATNYIACGVDAGIWQFGKNAYKKNKIYFLNNGIEIEKFIFNSKIRTQLRKELGFEQKTVIGHIGRFSFEKNQSFIIDLASMFKSKKENIIFVLVGDGQDFEKIKKMIDEKDLNDYVITLGARTDVNLLLNVFDLFILPSLFEAFPITLIEAQANGLACIVSKNVTSEAKLNNKFEFIEANEENLSKWYNEIKKDANYKRVDRKFAEKVNEYDIKTISKNLEKYYLEMLGDFDE